MPDKALPNARRPPAAVYNLEVDAEHAYRVGSGGLLVHNTCAVFNDAMRAANGWLGEQGFDAAGATPFAARMSARHMGGRINGMRNGSAGFRIEFDGRSGGHINAFAGKARSPHFMFGGNAADTKAILDQRFPQ